MESSEMEDSVMDYFEDYDTEHGRNQYGEHLLIKDKETKEVVGSVYYQLNPGEDNGTSVFYLGYGDKLHPERNAAEVAEIKEKNPRLAVQIFKWVRRNLPQPYYAAFANQDFKKSLKAEDTGMMAQDIETGEPVPVHIVRRSKENKKMSKVNLTPPDSVRSAAKRGIKYHSEGKAGKGFESATLTRAKKIAEGKELTPEHVKRMHSFFERHAGGRSEKAKKGEVTPWDVAWLAWGGNAGRSWAAKKVAEMERSEKKSSLMKKAQRIIQSNKNCNCWDGYKRVPGTKPCAPGSCKKCDSSRKKNKK
jgi:hypothetical protein